MKIVRGLVEKQRQKGGWRLERKQKSKAKARKKVCGQGATAQTRAGRVKAAVSCTFACEVSRSFVLTTTNAEAKLHDVALWGRSVIMFAVFIYPPACVLTHIPTPSSPPQRTGPQFNKFFLEASPAHLLCHTFYTSTQPPII